MSGIVLNIITKEVIQMTKENVTNLIKIARLEAGITQQALSDNYGIPLGTLRQWELGLRTPPDYLVNLLLDRLKADFNHKTPEPVTTPDAPKTLQFAPRVGKPYSDDVAEKLRQAYTDGKIMYLGAHDEEGNEVEEPNGKYFMLTAPEVYGLDMGMTFYVKEV